VKTVRHELGDYYTRVVGGGTELNQFENVSDPTIACFVVTSSQIIGR
jgi:hypothetical protein